jgi:hypothetical protein
MEIFKGETLKKIQHFIVAYIFISQNLLGQDSIDFIDNFIKKIEKLLSEP